MKFFGKCISLLTMIYLFYFSKNHIIRSEVGESFERVEADPQYVAMKEKTESKLFFNSLFFFQTFLRTISNFK